LKTDNSRVASLSETVNGLLYAGDRTIGAVSTKTGEHLWVRSHRAGDPAVFRPRPTGSLMIVGARSWLAAFEQTTGDEAWRYAARTQTGVPLVVAGAVIFGDGHEIFALDATSGSELWRFAGIPDTLASYAPTISDETVFAGPGDGHIYAIDVATGALRWVQDIQSDWQYLRQITIPMGPSWQEPTRNFLSAFRLETAAGCGASTQAISSILSTWPRARPICGHQLVGSMRLTLLPAQCAGAIRPPTMAAARATGPRCWLRSRRATTTAAEVLLTGSI
jgi:outer membrane protein assembly factor BamB